MLDVIFTSKAHSAEDPKNKNMEMKNMQAPANPYDTRWFIWTIVFLVVTGISLVSYIALSDTGEANDAPLKPAIHVSHKTSKN